MSRETSPPSLRRRKAFFLSWKSSSTLLAFVLEPTRASASCEPFLAESRLGFNMVVDDSNHTSTAFECEGDDAYISSILMDTVWWIDTLKVNCSDGQQSPAFGDESRTDFDVATAGGGWTAMEAFEIDMQNWRRYPGIPSVFVYDGESGNPSGSWIGPFGGGGTYSDEPTETDCGAGGYAVGFTVYTSDSYVLGLRLLCRNITETCPAPQGLLVPAAMLAPSLTPAPTVPVPTAVPSPVPSPVPPPVPSPVPSSVPSPVPTQAPEPEPEGSEGEACNDVGCQLDYCCSQDQICGSDESFCQAGYCCRTGDDDNCNLGHPNCESEEEQHWFETPIFIGLSSALAVGTTIVGACYATYRAVKKIRKQRREEQASSGYRPYLADERTMIPQVSTRPR